MSPSKEDALKEVPLFEGLSKRALRSVLKETQEEYFNEGQVIVKQGDPGGRFFLILKGRAKVTVGGRTRSKLGPGDFFGEMSLIDKAPRGATIQAETKIEALSITSWNFLGLLEEQWPMSKKVLEALSQRVRELDKPLTS